MEVIKATSSLRENNEILFKLLSSSAEFEQTSRAVSGMDNVVQKNAANAGECATASEAMNAQACQMEAFVHELVNIVGGTADARKITKLPAISD